MTNKIDKKLFEEKFEFILELLEPLINQLLVPNPKLSNVLGISRSAKYLLKFLDESLSQFAKKSIELSHEFQSFHKDLTDEISKFKENGIVLKSCSIEFVQDPTNSKKRSLMANQAKLVLVSTARILALFDLIDQTKLIQVVQEMTRIIQKMKIITSEKEFISEFKIYGDSLKIFLNISQNLIENMKNSTKKIAFISNRSLLAKQSLFLYSSSMSYLKHSTNEPSKILRNQVYQQALDALNEIDAILKNNYKPNEKNKTNNLLSQLIDLEKQVINLTPAASREVKIKIQNKLDDAIRTINNLTTQSIFGSNNKDLLVNECNAVSLALLDIFKAYESSRKSKLDDVESKENDFIRKNRSIRRQIRSAVAEQFGMLLNEPLFDLIDAAKSGDSVGLPSKIKNFESYAQKLIETSLLSCFLSSNKEGIQLVELTAQRLKTLMPLIISSARILCSNPKSIQADKNMNIFRTEWLNQLKLLNLAVDDIMSLNDFMAVSEYLILQDINNCILALNNLNAHEFKNAGDRVNQRTKRIWEFVSQEIFNYESCDYTNKINESVRIIKNKIIVNFANSVEFSYGAMKATPIGELNENDFIDSSRLLFDSIRDLRNALLMIPQEETDNHLDEVDTQTEDFKEPETEIELDPEINEKLNSFDEEKTKFDREVLKWDDNSNDIIVLSKQMCVLMMDMTNFTRGKGPLKTITQTIHAAKKISELGAKLEKLCRNLSDECPESGSKKELNGYLNLIPLFCNQLNIGSKVKENIIEPESVSSLLISSKNLMNTVASVVKTSYLASTKYTSKTTNKKPLVQWKMKPPELKPLIQKPTQFDTTGLVRKTSKRNIIAPLKLLSEFDA
ncbi:unnamed protein product [Brachionus calyciflorus]|uniref:Uncharacterized protein n=1 Tax=Brachionus calyciflorus TaxID=104777 RepID=A0A814CLY9_9BILA|nr:unnamed protein product [Brachionus calyciflorus]